MKRRGHNVNLGTALDGLVGRLDRKSGGGYSSARVSRAWEKVAGELVTSHTTGEHLRNGTLVVYVDSAAWATELTAMAEQYRVSLNEEIGEVLVSTVRFTVSRKVADRRHVRRVEDEAAASYMEDAVEPVPLTELEHAQVVSSVASIPDEALREAAIRATIKDMEWKKGIAARNSRERPSGGV